MTQGALWGSSLGPSRDHTEGETRRNMGRVQVAAESVLVSWTLSLTAALVTGNHIWAGLSHLATGDRRGPWRRVEGR